MLSTRSLDGEWLEATFECDVCGNGDVYEGEGFDEVIDQAKEDFWITWGVGNNFYHFCCKECFKEFRLKQSEEEI